MGKPWKVLAVGLCIVAGGCAAEEPTEDDSTPVEESIPMVSTTAIPETTAPPATEAPTTVKPQPLVATTARPTTTAAPTTAAVYYANCDAARAAGAAPISRGEPGYRSALDRDNDGVACDT